MKIMIERRDQTKSGVGNFSRQALEKWKCNQHKIWRVATLIRVLLFRNAFASHSACICQRRRREENPSFIRNFRVIAHDFLSFAKTPTRPCYSSSIVVGISSRRALRRLKSPSPTKENYSRWMRIAYFNLRFNLLSPVLRCIRGVTRTGAKFLRARKANATWTATKICASWERSLLSIFDVEISLGSCRSRDLPLKAGASTGSRLSLGASAIMPLPRRLS